MPIQKSQIISAALFSLLALAACNKEDTGTRCAVDETNWSATIKDEIVVGEEPIITDEQIMQDGICETFVCLNHEGIPPYCSRLCDDNQNVCPDGFRCAAVQELGAHAGDRYCVFDSCEKDSDCKDVKLYHCATFKSVTTDATQTFKRCQPRESES